MDKRSLYPPGLEIRNVSHDEDTGTYMLTIVGPTEICLIGDRRQKVLESMIALSAQVDLTPLLEGEFDIAASGVPPRKRLNYLHRGEVYTFVPAQKTNKPKKQ